jgi:hypothetical protein
MLTLTISVSFYYPAFPYLRQQNSKSKPNIPLQPTVKTQ